MHGRFTILILHVDISTLNHQQLHQVGVALCYRQLQRCLVAVVTNVDVAASLWRGDRNMKSTFKANVYKIVAIEL